MINNTNISQKHPFVETTKVVYTFGGVVEDAYPRYTVLLSVDPTGSGTVTGDGSYEKGDSVTVVATPAENCEFDGWYDGETKVSENTSYTFTVEGARTLVAKFKEATPTPPSETLFYKNMEGATGLFVVNTEGCAIYNKSGMGFNYADGVVYPARVGGAPIPSKQYDFSFNLDGDSEISIDGVTYTFMKRKDTSGYTVSPSINAFPS